MDEWWCLTCSRQLDVGSRPTTPDIFDLTSEDDDVRPPAPPPPPVAAAVAGPSRAAAARVRHAPHRPPRQHVHHQARKSHAAGRSSATTSTKAKSGITSVVNSVVKAAEDAVTAAAAPTRPPPQQDDTPSQQQHQQPKSPWAHLYCSEECMHIDEQRARLGLADLEPPKSPRIAAAVRPAYSGRSDSAGSRGSVGSNGSTRDSLDESRTSSPFLTSRRSSSGHLQALTPLSGSTPMQMRQHSHNSDSRSQSEDLGRSFHCIPSVRLSSSVTSTQSQPITVGTLRPDSAHLMRPSSLNFSTSLKTGASTPVLNGTSVAGHTSAEMPPPPLPAMSPRLQAQHRSSTHKTSLSTSSTRYDGSPESPNSLFSRSSISTAPSSSRWIEEHVDGPPDVPKSPLHTGYGLYHRLPRRNASSSSLSRSPPAFLHSGHAVSGLTALSISVGPSSEPQGFTISDVFRADQARRTASSAALSGMHYADANSSMSHARSHRPAGLHAHQHSSASSDSSGTGEVLSPLPSPALLASQPSARLMSREGSGSREMRSRPNFVYEAMPDSPGRQPVSDHLSRNYSEGDVRNAATAQFAAKARRKKLFHFPTEVEVRTPQAPPCRVTPEPLALQ